MRFFRGRKQKIVAVFLAISILNSVVFPTAAFALTGGPSQPEVNSFSPIGTSDMVDLFTGDFKYNIPLLDVGGYPLNIAYSPGSGPDTESSFVGLGWNINPGVIGRTVRGLPDDFKGDNVRKEYNIKGQQSFGVSFSPDFEAFAVGGEEVGDVVQSAPVPEVGTDVEFDYSLSAGISYNNYNGVGFEFGFNPSFTMNKYGKSDKTSGLGASGEPPVKPASPAPTPTPTSTPELLSTGTIGADMGVSSGSGVTVSPSVSFSKKIKDKDNKDIYSMKGGGIGLSINSRQGFSTLTMKRINDTSEKKKLRWSSKFVAGSKPIGAALTFNTPSYTPKQEMPMINVSASLNLNLGPDFFGVQGELGTSGYYTGQFLSVRDKNSKAYGYLYSEKADKFGLHDFNRENEGAYTKETPNLPITSYTYDIFSVSGQGLGGTFRPFRNDVGILHDQRQGGFGRPSDDKGGTDISVGVGAEIGMGALTKWGVNVNSTVVNTNSGDWNLLNSLNEQIDFRSAEEDTENETFYFKQAGELHVDKETNIFNKIGGFEPVEPVVNTLLMAGAAPGKVSDEKGSVYKLFHSDVSRSKRRNRNQVMKISTANEAQFNAVIEKIESYQSNYHVLDQLGQYILGLNESSIDPELKDAAEELRKAPGNREGHHISEIKVLRPDGVSYVYGIPAYNTTKKEVTMAVDREGDCSTGMVTYLPGEENSRDNSSGSDHFFDRQTTPAYAHSFLLTAVVSSDYVDITGNGPSDDDLGTYTKFNYSKKYKNYKWRVPFGENLANYSEGLKSLNTNSEGSKASDNKGSYTYGEKEVWYIHSIVTKNYIAEFSLSDRKDGYEVAGENGGFGERSLQKLDRIDLFSKADKLELENEATPLKSVHFNYDYSLCPGVPNNIDGLGKLTLKRVYFTYEKSNKAILNSYRFNYSSFNPGYDVKAYDRWGNYKPEGSTTCDVTSPISNAEFPYVDQDKSLADKYAEAWSLNEIQLPSGGKIKVTYEADDYSFVQDKRSMQMFKILGAGQDDKPIIVKDEQNYKLGLDDLYSGNTPYNYIYFQLKKPIAGDEEEADKAVKKQYIEGVKDLYFRFLLNLNNNGGYEYVSGYADPNKVGVVKTDSGAKNEDNEYLFGYIELKTVKLENKSIASSGYFSGDINPISKAGWNFTRKNLPRMAYGQPNVDADGFTQFLQAIGSSFKQLGQFIAGFNRVLKMSNFSKQFIREKSWIRLTEPSGFKTGGGSRVRKIEMSDEWKHLSGIDDTFSYGQEYSYTTEESSFAGETGKTISSGVAAYEPQAGSDENPFKKPIYFGKDNLLAPDDGNYAEEPLGEIFFPGASVGYRKVTVKDLKRDNVTKNATGKVVHQFFTAKEFPTIVKRTTPDPKQNMAGKIFSFLKLNNFDHLAVSQGFVVELNDMHGKQRKQEVFPEGSNTAISSVEYFYKSGVYDIHASDDELIQSSENQSEKRRLANKADVIYKYSSDGKPIKKALIGVDYDFVADMVRSETITIGGGVDFNADAFIVAIVPVIIPIPLPKLNFEHTGYYQATMTKVINRYSLLDKTVARDLGSEVVTENLLYDAETGEVLLTKTVNEFDDPVYNFTYPAHWAYDRMGMAYENTGLTLKSKELSDIGSMSKLFHLTDELLLVNPNNANDYEIVWVTSVSKTSNSIQVVNRKGETVFDGEWDITINRSGKKNMQTTPVGTITTLTDPRVDVNNDNQFDRLVFENVLNAGMTEYTDLWQVDCNCGLNPSESSAFLAGAIGSWRPLKSWVYLSDRTKTKQNNNTNTRIDGVFEHYSDFWVPSTTEESDWQPESLGWQYTTEVSFFNMHGLELENKDALDRYSAALYGHYFSLPKAVSNNAKVSEVAFDSFEDYLPSDCDDDHFSYRKNRDKVTSEESHSGRRSIKLKDGEEINVRKVIKKCN